MMPNLIDPYVGRTPDLSMMPDVGTRTKREPRSRRSGGLVDQLARMTTKLLSLLF